MGVENMSEGHLNTRKVLGEVTNQIGKRGFSAILDNVGVKSSDGNYKNGGMTDRENVHVMDKDTGKRARPCTEINSLKGNAVAGISSIPCDRKELNLLDFTVGRSVTQGTSKSRDGSKVSADDGNASRLMCMTALDSVDVEVICDSDEARLYSRGSQDDDSPFSLEGDANVVDNLVLSQTESVDCARLPESQESISFKLERCTGLKGNGGSSLTVDDPLITSCSCSFCKKAAYIWFDLHYQDMKGLIATLKKSQKDASVLADKTSKNKGKGIVGTDCSGKQSNLEHDLISQWRSLFLQMEEMFANEGKQLETRLLPLQDLRERSKMALELANNPTPAKND